MTLQEAKLKAQSGIKVTHRYFGKDEYMIMIGNIIIFEDGVKVFFDEFVGRKDYLLEGWSVFKEVE